MNKKFVFFVLVFLCRMGWAQDPSTACLGQLKDDSRLQALFEKFPFDMSRGQSLAVLANQSKATAKDKTALSIMVEEGDRCYELGAEWRRLNYPASINSLSDKYLASIKSSMADLYAGKLTFGALAKIRTKEHAEFQNQIGVEVDKELARRSALATQKEQEERQAEDQRKAEIRLSLEKSEAQRRYDQQRSDQADAVRRQEAQQEEQARRQAILQILANQRQLQMQQQQQQNDLRPLYRPSQTTNCSAYGNQLNCTTR